MSCRGHPSQPYSHHRSSKSFDKHGTSLLSIDISLFRRRAGWRTENVSELIEMKTEVQVVWLCGVVLQLAVGRIDRKSVV